MISNSHDSSDDEADLFCPALPPHISKKNSKNGANSSKPEVKILGPTLPSEYDLSQSVEIVPHTSDVEEDNLSSSGDEANLIGPILPNDKQDTRYDEDQLAYRAYCLKNKEDSSKKGREAWMLELPEDKPKLLALGLGSRQFKKKNPEKSGDRSNWTDTPADKERKAKLGLDSKPDSNEETIEAISSKKRDESLTNLVQKFTEEKRSVPLIESHGKKRKKEKEGLPNIRRPFSRDEDMSVNKFDEAQKETILKKARLLNDRFSAGNRKFL